MSLNLAQASAKLGVMLDMDVQEGDYPSHVRDWLNAGGRRVWEMRPWYGRVVETVLASVAPYSTGTATFTLGSASVTGSGTTWTAAMTGRKIALGIGSVWYRFTYVSATSGTLDQVYAEPTATASTYTIFQDEFNLPTTAETIKGLWLYSTLYSGIMLQRTQDVMSDRLVVGAVGRPILWGSVLSQTAGTRRLRVSPIPDAIYRLECHYLSAFTDLVAPGDQCVLMANRERAWLLASCLEAQRGGDARQVTSEAEVQAAVAEAFSKEAPTSPITMRRRPVGSGIRRGGFYLNDDRTGA